uniref:Chromo domain-containing protein n=1 Tax=Ascaris lumbricoides TaxID=6252 RepID=A0A0M3I054_ASCLU
MSVDGFLFVSELRKSRAQKIRRVKVIKLKWGWAEGVCGWWTEQRVSDYSAAFINLRAFKPIALQALSG